MLYKPFFISYAILYPIIYRFSFYNLEKGHSDNPNLTEYRKKMHIKYLVLCLGHKTHKIRAMF